MKKIIFFIFIINLIPSYAIAGWMIPVVNCSASAANNGVSPFYFWFDAETYLSNTNPGSVLVNCSSPVLAKYGDLQVDFVIQDNDNSYYTGANFMCKGIAYDITGEIVQTTETILLDGSMGFRVKMTAPALKKISDKEPATISAFCIIPGCTINNCGVSDGPRLTSIKVY